MYSNSKGFSLIELSVVVVLIGLIVASVVGGKNLIDQAKLRQQMSELQITRLELMLSGLNMKLFRET